MTEQELRVLVRDAIAQQLGRPTAQREGDAAVRVGDARDASGGARDRTSFSQFGVPSGADGTCIIEPSVMCNHCGYCKSYGH